jgi:hypothetical protein
LVARRKVKVLEEWEESGAKHWSSKRGAPSRESSRPFHALYLALTSETILRGARGAA